MATAIADRCYPGGERRRTRILSFSWHNSQPWIPALNSEMHKQLRTSISVHTHPARLHTSLSSNLKRDSEFCWNSSYHISSDRDKGERKGMSKPQMFIPSNWDFNVCRSHINDALCFRYLKNTNIGRSTALALQEEVPKATQPRLLTCPTNPWSSDWHWHSYPAASFRPANRDSETGTSQALIHFTPENSVSELVQFNWCFKVRTLQQPHKKFRRGLKRP